MRPSATVSRTPNAREHCRVQVLGVVVEAEDRRRRAADPLALEELRVEGVGAEHARLRQRLGRLGCAPVVGVDEPDADVAVEQHARDRRAHLAGAEHDEAVDVLAARAIWCSIRAPMPARR